MCINYNKMEFVLETAGKDSMCSGRWTLFFLLSPAPFPPVSCSFPEPCLGPQCCLYNLLEGQLEISCPKGKILYNIQSL